MLWILLHHVPWMLTLVCDTTVATTIGTYHGIQLTRFLQQTGVALFDRHYLVSFVFHTIPPT